MQDPRIHVPETDSPEPLRGGSGLSSCRHVHPWTLCLYALALLGVGFEHGHSWLLEPWASHCAALACFVTVVLLVSVDRLHARRVSAAMALHLGLGCFLFAILIVAQLRA